MSLDLDGTGERDSIRSAPAEDGREVQAARVPARLVVEQQEQQILRDQGHAPRLVTAGKAGGARSLGF